MWIYSNSSLGGHGGSPALLIYFLYNYIVKIEQVKDD